MSDLEKITIDLDPKRLPSELDVINVQQALEASIREILEPDESLLGQLESEFHGGGRVYIFHRPENLEKIRRRVEDFLRSIGYECEAPNLLPAPQDEVSMEYHDDRIRIAVAGEWTSDFWNDIVTAFKINAGTRFSANNRLEKDQDGVLWITGITSENRETIVAYAKHFFARFPALVRALIKITHPSTSSG